MIEECHPFVLVFGHSATFPLKNALLHLNFASRFEDGIHCDWGIQNSGNRAPRLCFIRRGLESCLVCARHPGGQVEVNRGDREPGIRLFQRNDRCRLDAFR
jgi:hypothetical protein